METRNIITIQLQLTRRKALFLLTVLFLAWHPRFLGSETLTLTTYYPAPYGGYASLLTTGQTLLARDGGNVGIGTPTPRAKLEVNGIVRAAGFQMHTGAANNYVLTSDANGLASWKETSGIPASAIWAEVASASAGGGCSVYGYWRDTPCRYTVGAKGGNVGRFSAGGGGCYGGPGRLLVNGSIVSTGGGRVDIPVAAGSYILVQVMCTSNGCSTIQKASCELGLWDY